jgi:hypothetical protein
MRIVSQNPLNSKFAITDLSNSDLVAISQLCQEQIFLSEMNNEEVYDNFKKLGTSPEQVALIKLNLKEKLPLYKAIVQLTKFI